MRFNAKRVLAALCGVIMLCNTMGLTARAEEIVEVWAVDEYQEPAEGYTEYGINDIPENIAARAATLTGCTIGISVNANGVRGSLRTGSTVMASEIGITSIRVEKYVDGRWTLVGTHSGGSRKNDNVYAMDIYTNSAQKGVQYRISCTHYAILNGEKHSVYNETKGVSY